MSTLYVMEPGARLEKEYQRIAVFKDDQLLQRVPLAQVTDVVLVGAVGVTTPAMIALLEAGAPLSIVRSTGQLLGRLTPPTLRNIPLRHRQYQRAADPAFCLQVSKAIVAGKLRNQAAFARRICRTRPVIADRLGDSIIAALRQVEQAANLDSLRGLEGSAAKAYFDVLRQSLPPGWESPRRSRRPPRDAFNALLSFGYTLLGQNVITALEVTGLDPYDGFFHADKYGRPALALDLVEEFRSVIVDSLALTLVNKRMLQPDDFQAKGDGVVLRPAALRKFLKQYVKRLQTEVFHPLAGKRLTYQKCLEMQARLLRKAIESDDETYLPLFVR